MAHGLTAFRRGRKGKRKPCPAAFGMLAVVVIATPALAKDDDDTQRSSDITVTATRTPVRIIDAPASVTVIDAREIEDNLHQDIKDLVRFEPGVSVRSSPSRFSAALGATGRDGNAGFNIRGLEGNRVLIQQDGIRFPDAFAFGAQSAGRGDYADLDLLKSVEVLRGPASALYGSDGLAGAVSFTTKDPDDLLAPGQSFGGRARLAWSEADSGWAKGIAIAGRQGDLQMLLAYTRRDSSEQKNQGTNDAPNITRTAPNPQSINSNAVLAKLIWTPGQGHRVRATYEHKDSDVATNVLSAVAIPPLSASSTLALAARDDIRRNRYSLDYRYEGAGLIRRANAVVYHQQSNTRQFSAEDRNTSADRTRDNRFDNRVTGFNGQLESDVDALGARHAFLLGGDYSLTRQTGVRDGTVPPFGETFPTRAFPVTDYTLAGVFVQDSIDIGHGRLLLYPALRFDYYKLDPKADPLFRATPARQSDNRLSPKIGAVLWATDQIGVFANYAEGFRAPTPSQVNNGFVNLAQGYTSIANPDLRPETSRSIEGGLRVRDANVGGVKLFASVTGFSGWYRDFIDQRQIGGNFTPGNPAVFQYVNVGRVRIAGIEGRADAEFGGGFGATVAASYAHGRQQDTGGLQLPLSSVDPFKIVGGLRYARPDKRIGGQVFVTYTTRKAQGDVNEACSPNCFRPASFVIADATAFFAVTDWATARVGIFNLFDAKYAWWSDVRGLSSSSTVTDAYTQPGRNVSASLTLRF